MSLGSTLEQECQIPQQEVNTDASLFRRAVSCMPLDELHGERVLAVYVDTACLLPGAISVAHALHMSGCNTSCDDHTDGKLLPAVCSRVQHRGICGHCRPPPIFSGRNWTAPAVIDDTV